MSRRLAVIGAATGLALVIGYLVVWAGVSPVRQRGSDFSVALVAGQMVRDGHGAQLYDQALEHARHASLLPGGVTFNLPYISPPATALLALPATLLDPETAYRIWSLLQLTALGAALWLAVRAAPWPGSAGGGYRVATVALAAASPATLVLLLMGQWDGLIALGLAVAYASWRRERPATAGFALALALSLTKPHLGLGLAAFLLARRDGRAVTGALAGVALAVVLSVVTSGVAGLGGFASALDGALSNTPPQSTLGLAGLVSSWIGSGPATAVLVAAGSVAALAGAGALGALSRRAGALEWALGGAVTLSLLVAPHLLAHDLVLLSPPMIWCTARALGGRTALDGRVRALPPAWPLFVIVLLGALIAADAGNGASAPPGRVVPLGLIACGAAAVIALRPRRQRAPASRAAAGLPA